MKSLIIAVDYDQTIRAGNFPFVFTDIGAIPVLKRLVNEGHKIILYTLRCDRFDKVENGLGLEPINGTFLTEAIEYLEDNEVPLFSINSHPNQKELTDSPKCWADIYIDDRAMGTPLIYDKNISEEPFVNWKLMEWLLEERKILTKNN